MPEYRPIKPQLSLKSAIAMDKVQSSSHFLPLYSGAINLATTQERK